MQPFKVNTDRAKEIKKKLQEESNRLPVWSPKEGRWRIRFLPPWSSAGEVGYQARIHWNLPPDNNSMPCPHTVERECELCDYIKELRIQKHPKAAEMYAKRRIFYNIILRDEEDKGPQVYASGVQVYEAVLAYLYDDEWGDITDVETGRDMILERTGQSKEDTRYQLLPTKDASPLHTDASVVAKWLDAAQNLDEAVNMPEEADVIKIVGKVKHSIQLSGGAEQRQISQPNSSDDKPAVKESTKALSQKLDSEIEDLIKGGNKIE